MGDVVVSPPSHGEVERGVHGIVRARHVDPNGRERTPPHDVLVAVASIRDGAAMRMGCAECGCVVDRRVRVELCDDAQRCSCAALSHKDWDVSGTADPGIDVS